MSVDTLLNSLFISDTNSMAVLDILFAVFLPFVLSFVITLTYRSTQRHTNYATSFIHSIFLFSSLTSIVTMIIGSNIARAFGLIGALSIIRFRNALKSPLDAVYIFWGLVVGMACGTGFYLAAVMLTLACASFMILLDMMNYGSVKHADSILKVFTTGENDEQVVAEVERTLKASSRHFKRLNVLFDSGQNSKTYVYMVRANDRANSKIQEVLRGVTGISRIHHLNSEVGAFIQ